MGENYISVFDIWGPQDNQYAIQKRLGITPMTEQQKRIVENAIKEIDNPGYLESRKNAKESERMRSIGIVEKNPGLQTMGQVLNPSLLYYVPVVGDAMLAGEAGYNALTGNYGDALLSAGLLAAPSIIGGAGKAVSKAAKLDDPLYVYTGKQLGEKVGKGRPASNINTATGNPITMRDVLDAMKNNGRTVYENTSEEAIKSAAIQHASDTRSKYLQVLDALERKANKVKSDWDRKRGLYQTKKRTGKIETSNLPIVTTYLEENILSTFKPSKKTIKKGDFDSYYNELLDHISNLGYDIESKESREAINKIALNTSWGKQVPGKKQGGILNYSTYFS